jgi:hypothetical protein
LASTFSEEFGAFITAASQAHQVSRKSVSALPDLIYDLHQTQSANNADINNFEEGFGIDGLFDEIGNKEPGNVGSASGNTEVNQVEKQIGLLRPT